MTGNFVLHPSRKRGSCQVSLRKIVEAEDALVVGFGGAGEGMQSTAARMSDDRIHGRKLIESRLHHAVYLVGIGNIGRKIDIGRRRNLPIIERPVGLFLRLDVGEHQRCAACSQPPHQVLGNRTQGTGDQNCLAREINADHDRLPPAACTLPFWKALRDPMQ